LGIALIGLREIPEAITAFSTGVEIDPFRVNAWKNLAISHCIGGCQRAGLKPLRRALELEPENPDLLTLKAQILLDVGDHPAQSKAELAEQAAQCARKAATAAPSLERWNWVAKICRTNGLYEEAVDAYRKSLELDSDQELIWQDLGSTQQNLGRVDEAEMCYRRALSRNDKLPGVWANLGALAQEQDPEKALEFYDHCLSIDPTFAPALWNAGYLLAKLETTDQAIACFEHFCRHAHLHFSGEHLQSMLDQANQEISTLRKSLGET
jgi:tetratricopeptide (TPR) repeat protein